MGCDAFKFGAVVNALYVLAGISMFITGHAPVCTQSTNLLNDKFAMAWAGWKFSGCLYFALVNFGCGLRTSNALAMAGYIVFDIFAVEDPNHWTPLASAFIPLDGAIAVLSLLGHFKFGAVVNTLYVLAGVSMFVTGHAPVTSPSTNLLDDKFAMAWAGWKFSGCLYFALVNFGVNLNVSNAIGMAAYVAFDVFALEDTAHWTSLSGAFILLDGIIGIWSFFSPPRNAGDGEVAKAREFMNLEGCRDDSEPREAAQYIRL